MRNTKEYSILYVDDEAANLRSFKAAFRRIYNVYVADSPVEGIELVKEHKVDIVVSDHKMPQLSGTEFLREVHAYDPSIRRIILSGFVSKEELKAANEEYGLHAYIPKPWDFEHVQAVLQKLLSEAESPIMVYK